MSGRVRAAVLSAGAWSRSSHLPALAADPRVELVAVSSPAAEQVGEIAAEFGVPRAETDWRAALAETEPEIVVVSSPPVAHEEQVVAALEAGAHVLVEKPFALESGAARRMHEAAVRADRALLIGFGWSAAPAFVTARRLVEEGEIGELEHLMNHLAVNTRALLGGATDGGWGGTAASTPSTYTDRRVSGGGAAAVSMSHQLGLVSWITGERFDDVTAMLYPQRADIELHVVAAASFSSCAGSAALSCASTHPYLARPQWHLAMYGSAGQLWVDSVRDEVRLVRADGTVVDLPPEQSSGVYDAGAPTKALIECAFGAPAPEGMASELGLHVVETTDALYRSAEVGGPVQVGAVG